MSNSATAQPPASRTVRAAVRREAPGRVIVGDYVGQHAARAVQAVRRAGLRPALERSFGCEGHLSGFTVAQAPPAGSGIARNGNVTLYVAAPAADAGEPHRHGDRGGSPAQQAARESTPTFETPPAPPNRRRRRKPGLAGRSAQQTLARAAQPILAATDSQPSHNPSAADRQAAQPNGEPPLAPAPSWAAQTVELHQSAGQQLRDETLLAEELFAAGGDRAAWMNAYTPSVAWRRWQTVGGRLGGRPVLAASGCAMLAVWVALALAGALTGPRASGAPRAAPAPIGIPDGTLPAEQRAPTHTSRPRGSLTAPARNASGAGRHMRRAGRRRITPASVASDPAGAGAEQQAAPVPAAGAQPHRSPAQTAAQAGGGPFSP